MNCAIINPHDLQSGDIIKLCGNAFSDSGHLSSRDFKWFVGYVQCSLRSGTDPLDVTVLFDGTFDPESTVMWCFSDSHILSSALIECDVQWVIGYHLYTTTVPSGNYDVKVSWTFSVERPG